MPITINTWPSKDGLRIGYLNINHAISYVHSQLSQVYQYTDPDETLEFWYKTFSSVYNKHAPFMTKRVRYTRKPPRLSKEIEEAMHQRDRLLKARKHEEFKKQRNKVTSLIHASKKHTFKI